MHGPSKTRSKTGCRTCRIRKVKCDEGKQKVPGQEEPQCNKCATARLRCEWIRGPIPRKSTSNTSTRRSHHRQWIEATPDSKKTVARRSEPKPLAVSNKSAIAPKVGYECHTQKIQAANSMTLSAFDRDCINYLQRSNLVVLLGKPWPWSTISYAYHKIAVNEPMVMSMILASTAREIRRSQLYDQETLSNTSAIISSSELDGSMHYGRALSGLRRALSEGVTSPGKIEAVFVTLWLMIDYENRFGNGVSAVNIHIRGVQSMLQDRIIPLLQNKDSPQGQTSISLPGSKTLPEDRPLSRLGSAENLDLTSTSHSSSLKELQCTSVPLFFLWTLYFFTPEALFSNSVTSKLDTDIFQSFFGTETHTSGLFTLPELYRISRQSPSRFWGDSYSLSAQLDDVENLPGLTLYHRSHVMQFKITELFKSGWTANVPLGSEGSSLDQRIVDEIQTLSIEYDAVFASVHKSPSCDTEDPHRRVLETNFWAAITYYSTIVYFHLCFQDTLHHDASTPVRNTPMTLPVAVSQVLELSLKLHRSRPRMLIRIIWPLIIAGIATSDVIYKDWVSIRLRELGRYGQNYTCIGERFDEMIKGNHPYEFGREGHILCG